MRLVSSPHPSPIFFFFFFFFFWKIIYFTEFQGYNLCNSISAYGKRGSLGAHAGFFQRGFYKYGSSRQTSQGQRNAGGGRVRVRVSVMFEYVECVTSHANVLRGSSRNLSSPKNVCVGGYRMCRFSSFCFQRYKFEALLLRTMSTVQQR